MLLIFKLYHAVVLAYCDSNTKIVYSAARSVLKHKSTTHGKQHAVTTLVEWVSTKRTKIDLFRSGNQKEEHARKAMLQSHCNKVWLVVRKARFVDDKSSPLSDLANVPISPTCTHLATHGVTLGPISMHAKVRPSLDKISREWWFSTYGLPCGCVSREI